MYEPKIIKIEISETDAGELKALLDTIEKDPSKVELTRLIRDLENRGFKMEAGYIYTIKRTNEDGTDFVSELF